MPLRLRDYYEYDINKVRRVIRERRAKRVLVQIPEGIKRLFWDILEELSSEVAADIEFIIDSNPVYGSCMIDKKVAESYDLVLHFGHDPYPLMDTPNNVLFIDLLSKVEISDEMINDLRSVLGRLGIRSSAVFTTQQHKHLVSSLGNELMRDFDVIIPSYPVITGCVFPGLREVKDVDSYIVVAGGSFHAIGLSLHIRCSKPVIRFDPYSSVVEDVSRHVLKLLSTRLWKIEEARNARYWLVISGTGGQYRPNIVANLVRLLRSRDCKVAHATVSYLSIGSLRNIDSDRVEAIVITSCPRLAIDDLRKYEKPILTPGEALQSLGIVDEYTYPW